MQLPISLFLLNQVIIRVTFAVIVKAIYVTENKNNNIICYDNAAVFISIVKTISRNCSPAIQHRNTNEKTKCMVVAKNPIRCKLEVDGVNII